MIVRGLLGIALLLTAGACGNDNDTNDAPENGGDSDVDTNTDTDLDTDDSPSLDTVPTEPIAFEAGEVVELDSGTTNYVLVPRSYDATHQTPIQVFIYLHGCGGASSDDVYAASNIDANWIGLAPGGAEGECWDNRSAGATIVMDAIADLKKHFNIDPKRIHIGGYSSGGDLSYYTALRNAATFAGVLSYNSQPAWSTSELQDAIAAAAWKLNIVHLSQTEDGVYPIATVRAQMQLLSDAGFPVEHIERPGTHYDENTTGYRNDLVYPHLNDGWRAP